VSKEETEFVVGFAEELLRVTKEELGIV